MTDLSINESRPDRYGKTERKIFTLTTEAVAAIQEYADRHGLYLSVAIETLAMMGLGHTTADSLPRLVTSVIERSVNRQFNRTAKLLSLNAIAAEEINYKVDTLLLQMIRQAAEQHPQAFAGKLQVSADPDQQPDARIRQLRDGVAATAHRVALQRLRKPLKADENLMVPEESDDES